MYVSKFKSPLLDQLFKTIQSIPNEENFYRFFEDICTVKELQDLATRFEVARLLSEKVSYVDIVKQTKASSATIARVNRALLYGADGYKFALSLLKK
jgi:TrpR-related protein YerC/YecD